ncbi:MAG: CpsD/CapB family tyrosine-protein kinase [Terracidiphilus sp.]
MSRIFDACRRYRNGEAGEVSGNGPDAAQNGAEAIPFPELRPKLWESFPVITCQAGPDERVVACDHNQSLALEKFHLLSHRLIEIRQKWPLKTLTVTSCVPKEGKTIVTINLAFTLARNPGRVLLVDGDMRQPGISRTLRLDPLPGLADYLEGRQEFEAVVRRIEPQHVFYMPAGRASGNPFTLLQGPRMRELAQRLTPVFDWIVIDSPPLVPFADGHCLAKLSDAALLVVRTGVTPKEVIEKAVATLAGVRIAGVVWNSSEEIAHDRYYYAKYSGEPAPAAVNARSFPGGPSGPSGLTGPSGKAPRK